MVVYGPNIFISKNFDLQPIGHVPPEKAWIIAPSSHTGLVRCSVCSQAHTKTSTLVTSSVRQYPVKFS